MTKLFLLRHCLLLGLLVLLPVTSFAANYKMKEVAFDFEDISATGSTILENCDDCARAIDIGFDFTYYGRSYSRLYVSSNGFIIPGSSNPGIGDRMGCCNARTIPYVDNLVGVMAVWWNDLSMKKQKETSDVAEEDGSVLYELQGTTPDRVLIIQYNKVRHFHNLETNASNTFQVKLFESSHKIEYHYKKIVANRSLHAIGIENPSQEQGKVYFYTEGDERLPSKSEKFAVRFTPPGENSLVTSQRFSADGNVIQHVIKVNETISTVDELVFTPFDFAAATLTAEVDFDTTTLISNTPASFSIIFELEASLANEDGGTVYGDEIEFSANGTLYKAYPQTTYIEQLKVLDQDEATVRGVSLNHNATLASYRSKDNLLDKTLKNESVDDIFFFGRDPDTQVDEAYQLTNLQTGQTCGPAFIDNNPGSLKAKLYVVCNTGDSVNEVAVFEHDLQSYLDDDLKAASNPLNETVHEFEGNISENAWVVSANTKLAYAKADPDSPDLQDVYFDDEKINTSHDNGYGGSSGVLKSLAIDATASKLLYVLDTSLYFYDVGSTTETLVTDNVTGPAALSRDGSVLAFASSENLDDDKNSDGSIEVYTALEPFDTFVQKTNLDDSGKMCKLPQLSEQGNRLAVVCNDDVLGLGNEFSNREAVFIIDELHGETNIHLITGLNNDIDEISHLVMSSDGATVSIQNAEDDNAYQLIGLNKLDSLLEENTAKDYPIPFKVKGDGKSGVMIYLLLLLSCYWFGRSPNSTINVISSLLRIKRS